MALLNSLQVADAVFDLLFIWPNFNSINKTLKVVKTWMFTEQNLYDEKKRLEKHLKFVDYDKN